MARAPARSPAERLARLPSVAQQTLTGHVGAVLAVRFNQDGEYCLSGGHDKLVKLWNPQRGRLIKTYTGHGREVAAIAVSHDNGRFASCGGERLVYVWDVATGRIVRRLAGHFQRINTVDFNKDATVLASGSYDATVRLWDLRAQTNEPIQVLDQAKDSITSVRVAAHSILVGSVDGSVREYDLRMGLLRTDHLGVPISSVSYSSDMNCVLVGCLDNAVRLLAKDTGELLGTYQGHQNTQYKLDCALSNDDAYVISGSEDHRIVVWDLVECKVVRELKGHTGVVSSLAYHPTEPLIVSSSIDGTLRLWGPDGSDGPMGP